MSFLDVLLTVALLLIWGLNFVVSKFGLAEIPPLLFIGLRFAIAAAILLPFARLPRGRIGGIYLLAAVFAAHFSFQYLGLDGMDVGLTALAGQAQVPFSAVLSAIVFKDYIGWRRALGLAIAFLGIVVLFGEPRLSGDKLPLFFILTAAMLWSIANIMIKRMGAIDSYALNAYLALFIAPHLFLGSYVFERGQIDAILNAGWLGWTGVLFNAIFVTVVSYAIWYRLLHRYPVNYIMPITMLVPVLGVLFGVLLRDEPLTWPIVTGGVITLAGVAIIVMRRPQTAAPEAATKSI